MSVQVCQRFERSAHLTESARQLAEAHLTVLLRERLVPLNKSLYLLWRGRHTYNPAIRSAGAGPPTQTSILKQRAGVLSRQPAVASEVSLHPQASIIQRLSSVRSRRRGAE